MSQQTEYIVVRDGFWWGVIGDLVMYGILLGLYVANYKWLGNNGVLNVIFTLFVLVFITNLFAGKLKKTFYRPKDAIKYLEKLGPTNGKE